MEQTIKDNLDEIKRLFKLYGAETAYLFGSAATDEMKETSDIDFLFQFPHDMHYEIYADNYFKLVDALEKLLKKNVDLVAEKTLQNPYLIQKINSQKIQLL